MCNFKVGQKVVCVEAIEELLNDEIYSIQTINNCVCGLAMVSASEVSLGSYSGSLCPCGERYRGFSLFKASRFRPLDHAFADEVEAMIKKSLSTVAVCFALLFSIFTYSQDTICLNQEAYSHIYAGLKQGEYYKAEYKNCLEVSTHLHELNKQLSDSLLFNIEKLEESYYDNDKLKYELEQKTPWYKKWYVLLTAGIITGILIK